MCLFVQSLPTTMQFSGPQFFCEIWNLYATTEATVWNGGTAQMHDLCRFLMCVNNLSPFASSRLLRSSLGCSRVSTIIFLDGFETVSCSVFSPDFKNISHFLIGCSNHEI